MRFIFDCEDKVLLPFLYDFAEDVSAFLAKTKLLEIRKIRDEGLDVKEQGKKNFKAMLKRICKEYPDETGELLAKLWVLDEGETAPNVIITLGKVLTNKQVIDFFTSLMALAS